MIVKKQVQAILMLRIVKIKLRGGQRRHQIMKRTHWVDTDRSDPLVMVLLHHMTQEIPLQVLRHPKE